MFWKKWFARAPEPKPAPDLRALTWEAMTLFPPPDPVDPEIILELIKDQGSGKYIKVARYPQNVPRAYSQRIMHVVSKWATWDDRVERWSRTTRVFPVLQIRSDDCACDFMRPLNGKIIENSEAMRVPVIDCDAEICRCWYKQVTSAEAREAGHIF